MRTRYSAKTGGAARTAAAVIAVALALTVSGCEWAQVGGGGGRSYANAGDTTFTAASLATLTPRWTVAVGDRYSQTVVSGGALYLTAASANAVKVVSLDVTTGATRWTRTLPSVGSAGADLAPAVASGRVLVSTATALVALDPATGTTRWSTPNTTAAAPLTSGGFVYLGQNAYDAATGAARWTAPAGTTIGAVDAGRAIVTSSWPCAGAPAGGSVLALDAATGTQLWGRHLAGDLAWRPMISGGSLLIAPAGCVIGSPLDGLLNLDAATGATRAWWNRGAGIIPDAAAHGLILEDMIAVRADTGQVMWRATSECAPPVQSPTVAVAGAVAFESNATKLSAFDVDTGTLLGHWTFGSGGDIPLSLIAADGCVYATSEWAGTDSINALCVGS